MRSASCLLLIVCLLATGGCARYAWSKPAFTATATTRIDPALQAAQGRREAIQMAEVRARDQIMLQAMQLPTPAGRTLGDLAIEEGYVQAMLQDTVRVARVSNRTVAPDGQVSVTVQMDQGPLDKIIAEYQRVNGAQ